MRRKKRISRGAGQGGAGGGRSLGAKVAARSAGRTGFVGKSSRPAARPSSRSCARAWTVSAMIGSGRPMRPRSGPIRDGRRANREKKGRSCERPGRRKSGGEVMLAAKCGGEGGDVFERRTHVQRRSLENGTLGAVPHHVLAGDDTHQSGRLGGDLRAGEVNRDLHGGRADRGDEGKCREGLGQNKLRQADLRAARSLARKLTVKGRSRPPWRGVGRAGARKTGRFHCTSAVVAMGPVSAAG